MLRAKAGGRNSIGLIGAISCARIYVHGAQQIASAVAAELTGPLDWSSVPEFPLHKGDIASPV